MSAALVHGGLPAKVRPRDLVALVKQVALIGVPGPETKILRVSRTAVAVLEYFVNRCREGDFEKGSICGVWEQPATIADELSISTKVLHNAEAELRKIKWIERTSTAHARRGGERRGGTIVALAGISLAPLIEKYRELLEIRDAHTLQQKAASDVRAEIVQIWRRIRELSNPDIIEQAEAILPRGRTSRISRIDQLEAIKADLEALLVLVNLPSGATKSSHRTEEIVTPNIPPEDSSQNCSAQTVAQPTQSGASPITPARAARLASSDYQSLLAAKGGPSWSNLVETSATTCSWLGISQSVWGDACQAMGRERAALCVLVIDRNRRLPENHPYHRKYPSASLEGMARRGGDTLNLNGLLRAIEGYQEGADGNVGADLQIAARKPAPDPRSMGRRAFAILSRTTVIPEGTA